MMGYFIQFHGMKPIMNMKKLSIATVIMLGMGMSAAQASDGTLNFTGAVSATPCTIDADSLALNINFDGVPVSKFANLTPGATSPDLQKAVAIKLSNCPAGIASVRMMLDGKTSALEPNIFVDASSISSYGVIVQDAETGSTITPKTFSGPANVKTITAGSNTLNYKVGLAKVWAEPVSQAKAFTIPINYTLSYQ
jgi:major type 1 subunit fimbrin (pilin)